MQVRHVEPGDRSAWTALRLALWPDEDEASHRSAVERFWGGPRTLGTMPEAVLVAVPGQRAHWLRSFFGAEPAVQVLDMADVGANPARIIPEWQVFLDAHAGRRVRGIGEPVWAGRSAAERAARSGDDTN